MPAAIAGAVIAAVGATGAAAALITIGVQVAVGAVVNKLSAALNKPKGAGAISPTQAISVTLRQAAAARRLVYGTVKAGGLLNYAAQSSDGEYVHLSIILGEGKMQGVDPVFWISDEKSDAAKFDDLVDLGFFDGTQTEASATLITAGAGEWTSAEVGAGIAYAVVEYKFDRNAFPGGLVLPAFLVKGRVIHDPRTNTFIHTNNAALVSLDYIRHPTGYNATDDDIDFESFRAAADICDEILDSIDPENMVNGVAEKVRRYTFDGVIETDVGPAASLAAIEQAMAGQVRHINGKWRCFAGAWRAPSGPVLTADFLADAPVYRTHAGRQQRVNIVRGVYREPKADWQDADYREQTLPDKVAIEGEIVQPLNFPGTTNGATAQRLARLAMMQSRGRVPLVLKCNLAALVWQELDVVTIDLPLMGISGNYVIDGYTYNVQDGGITLALFPHLASDYAWDAATNETLVPEVIRPNFNTNPAPPTNVQVNGAFRSDAADYAYPAITVTWTPSNDPQRKHFEIQWGQAGNFTGAHFETGSQWINRSVTVGQAYDVRIRSVRLSDTTSDWVTVTNTTAENDDTPPGPPANLSVTAGSGSGSGNPDTIFWRTPTDLDILRSRVYANSTNNPATATAFAEVFGLPGTNYSTTHPHSNSGTFYWVESVDRVGNTSARTFAGTA